MGSITKLVEYIENAPKEIRSILVGALLKSSLAMNNTENDLLKPDPAQLQTGSKKEYQKPTSNLLESLRRGDYNAEYVNHFYEVLRRADEIVASSSADEMAMLAEKYGMGSAAQNSYNMLNEDQKKRYGGKNSQDIRKEQISQRVTIDDNYQIDHMVINKRTLKNVFESAIGQPRQYDFTLKVGRRYKTSNTIEELCEYMHVKHLGENQKLLEFYIPKKYKIGSVEHSDAMNEVISFEHVSFADQYGKKYEYSIKKFYKISENNQYDVLKFNAVIIQNIGVGII
jgi:hypothetical protein